MIDFDDTEIILKLQSNGPKYLTTLYNKITNTDQKTILTKYEKLFLDEDSLFENNIKTYVECLKSRTKEETELWSLLCAQMSDDDVIKYISKFVPYIIKLNFNDKLIFYKKIFSSARVLNLLENKYEIWDFTVGTILNTLVITKSSWYNQIKKTQRFIKTYIKNKYVRKCFIDWLSNILNVCTKKIHIEIDNYNKKLPSDYYITNILGILLEFWTEGIKNEKLLSTIDYNFIIDSKICKINWFDKKDNLPIKNYNFMTQCFFLILNTLRVGYIPILYRALNWDEELDSIEEEIEYLNENNHIRISNVLIKDLEKQKKFVKNYIFMDNMIVDDFKLKCDINDFYAYVIPWLIQHRGHALDDILIDMIHFYMNSDGVVIQKNNLYDFALDVAIDKSYTKNSIIRYEFIELFEKYLLNNNDDNVNEDEDEDIVTHHNVETHYLEKYATGILKLYVDLESSNTCGDHKLLQRSEILLSLHDHYLLSFKMKDILKKVMIDNINIIKKFLHLTFSDICDLNDSIDKLYNDYEEQDDIDEITILRHIYIIFTMMMKKIVIMDTLIRVILSSNELKQILFSRELFTTFSLLLNVCINDVIEKLDFGDTDEFDIFNTNHDLNMTKYIICISNIFYNLYVHDCNLSYFISNGSFKLENYMYFKDICDEFEVIYIQICNKLKETNYLDQVDIPEEFLDPITYQLISDPCLLPGTAEFSDNEMHFDRSTIIKNLLIKEENPYTRASLTINEFEEFNSQKDITEINDKFKIKLNDWKKNLDYKI